MGFIFICEIESTFNQNMKSITFFMKALIG